MGLLHCRQIFFFFFLPSEPLGKPDYPPNTYGSLVPYAHGNHSAHLVLTVEDKSEIKVQIHKASLKPLGGPSHAFLYLLVSQGTLGVSWLVSCLQLPVGPAGLCTKAHPNDSS